MNLNVRALFTIRMSAASSMFSSQFQFKSIRFVFEWNNTKRQSCLSGMSLAPVNSIFF